MDEKTRRMLNHVAVAAQQLADELDPDRQWWQGHADDFRQFIEWQRDRVVTPIDASALVRTLATFIGGNMLTTSDEYLAAVLNHSALPENVLDTLADICGAVRSLKLQDKPLAESISTASTSRLHDAGARLEQLVMFVPSKLQEEILKALDGVALTADKLEECLEVSRHTLFGGKDGKGGLKELKAIGMVQNSRKVGGYFRPDAPPK